MDAESRLWIWYFLHNKSRSKESLGLVQTELHPSFFLYDFALVMPYSVHSVFFHDFNIAAKNTYYKRQRTVFPSHFS